MLQIRQNRRVSSVRGCKSYPRYDMELSPAMRTDLLWSSHGHEGLHARESKDCRWSWQLMAIYCTGQESAKLLHNFPIRVGQRAAFYCICYTQSIAKQTDGMSCNDLGTVPPNYSWGKKSQCTTWRHKWEQRYSSTHSSPRYRFTRGTRFRHPMSRGFVGLHNCYGRSGGEVNLLAPLKIQSWFLRRAAHSVVTILTELSRLPVLWQCKNSWVRV